MGSLLPASPQALPTPHGLPSPLLLRQLQYLPSDRLDRLVEGWLTSLGFRAVRLWERRGTISTYEARFGDGSFAIPARVRVHQRLRHLELSHVESFLGHLVRSGSPLGILVTPGECSWAAGLGARTPKLPFLRLCGGAEWADELASARPSEKERENVGRQREVEARPHTAAPTRKRKPEAPCDASKGQWRGGYRIW